MAINPQGHKMTVEEYFQLDSDPSAKYEYIEGYAVVMSGGSVGHARIAKNIVRELDSRLQAVETQCEQIANRLASRTLIALLLFALLIFHFWL